MKIKKLTKYNRLIAIGDIHGCIELIEPLLTHLENDENINQKDQIVFLGDYIDRGENSRKVIDLLINFKEKYPKTTFLKGNHEDMFLNFMGLEGHYGEWHLINGGTKFFANYGLIEYVKIRYSSYDGDKGFVIDITPQELFQKFPKEHRDFFLSLDYCAESKKCIFVHAGVDTSQTLNKQNTEDLVWIRDLFFDYPTDIYGKTFIHGHTIGKDVLFRLPFRICLDTGSFLKKDGKISCIIIDENDMINSTIIQMCRFGGLKKKCAKK